jgi:hypothetical protein
MESRTSPRPEPFDATLDPYRRPWNPRRNLERKAVQLPASTGDVVLTPAGLSATTG